MNLKKLLATTMALTIVSATGVFAAPAGMANAMADRKAGMTAKADKVALTDEEKEAKKAEMEAKKAEMSETMADRKAGMADKADKVALTDEEKEAKKAEMEAKKAEFDALTDEEKAALKSEMGNNGQKGQRAAGKPGQAAV